MADETNPDVSFNKSSFISPLNEETTSSENSSSMQHIEETQQQKVSSEDNNNHSHIEPIQNGDHQHDSSTIQNGDHIQHSSTLESNQTTENNSNQTEFIQESIPDEQQPTSPSHIQPLNTQDSSHISLEQPDSSDNQNQSNIIDDHNQTDSSKNQDQSVLVDNNNQSNNTNNQDDSNLVDNNDQPNVINNQNDSSLLLGDHQTPNIDTSLNTEIDLHQKPDELKVQRELDEDEIPPAEISVDETATNHSTTQSETNITDTRPLTALETPYEHHQKNESYSLQSLVDQNIETNVNDNHPLTERETSYEDHQKNELTLGDFLVNKNIGTSQNENHPLTEVESSYGGENKNEINNISLPDLVTETIEQNPNHFIPEPIELEKLLMEEIPVKNEAHFTAEDFPPLPPTSIAMEQTLHSESTHLYKEDFPPLPPPLIAVEQTLHTESNHSNKEQHPLFSKTEPILSEPEDILGNKTLLKQTIVKGINGTNPTRSTMVTISYTLSLVDNLTSNIRLIENVSNERFFVSENDIIPAIDISVQKMNRGERALIDADIRHCYGEIGCEEKQIPPITSLNPYKMKIDLELHDWISPLDVQTLSIEERLHWGDKKRQMGNFYYRRQDFPISLQCYHGALRFLDIDNNPILSSCDENQRSILNDRYIQVQNNVAQVNLHLDKYDACLNAVENVLKHDTKNVKALFRQGKALFKLGKYDQAIQPLKLLSQIQRENSTTGLEKDQVNEMISVCENKLANYQKNEKEIYRRMFQPPPPPTTTTSSHNQQGQTKNSNQIDNTNNNWWPYIALGSAVLATIGLVTFIKYRKVS